MVHILARRGLAAVALCQALAAAPPLSAGDLPDPSDLAGLVAGLERWLDQNAAWPARDAPPAIRFVSPYQAAGMPAAQTARTGRLRGIYDPESGTIYLVRPWSMSDPADVSILLHELVHHRQVGAHFYCPGAEEEAAYRLQAAWAEDLDVTLQIDWFAVILDGGCTRRDIHPD